MGQAPKPLTPHLSAVHLLGAELRHWRERRGLSQNELGLRVNFSGDHIAKVEKAERFPTVELMSQCDTALETGGVLARVWPTADHERRKHADNERIHTDFSPGPRPESSPQAPSLRLLDECWPKLDALSSIVPTVALVRGDEEVRRRQLFGLSGAALTSQIIELLDREPDRMRAMLDITSTSEQRLSYFETTADLLGERVVQLPPSQLLEPTLTHFRTIRSLLTDRQSTKHQVRLTRCASKLATIAGEILFNQGAFSEAQQWYGTALHAASDIGDQFLVDITLAGLAYIPTYTGDPAGVLRLVSDRLSRPANSTAAVAWLWGSAARAYAALGDRKQFVRAISRSGEALDSAPRDTLRAGIFSFLPEKLAFYEANGYARLGDATRTADAAMRALKLYDPRETMEPALVRLDHATGLAIAGEVDQACAVAVEALASDNVVIGVAVSGRAAEFDRLLDKAPTCPSVADWRERLHDALKSPVEPTDPASSATASPERDNS